MDLSFIIVNYNTTVLTLACIGSVYQFTQDNKFEVILIDNASADRSILEVKTLYPDVIFLECPENVGFGRANNLGITHAGGKYVFLLNSDALLISDAASVFLNLWKKTGTGRWAVVALL
ncbi:glycosyltransferase [Pedobacter sp. P26]|uniref:glycosyltransferase n=1 Tax=Pedobacter sp. P26 TaxID=3423956 RepID=UPI003D671829